MLLWQEEKEGDGDGDDDYEDDFEVMKKNIFILFLSVLFYYSFE